MTDEAGAERAIQELDDIQIGGRTLNVRFAEEKEPVKPAISPRRDNRIQAPKPKRPRRPL